MTKYIKTSDGKFAGSIGDGKTVTPTSAPPMPPARRVRNAPEAASSIEEQYANFQKHYFSADGNYGDAESLTVVDTSNWTNEDWDTIDETVDYQRVIVARQIESKYKDQ